MIELPGASPLLCELAARGVRYTYRKGRLLIAEGEPGDAIYIILSGRLRAFSVDAVKDREITYGTYGPGEYVGEMSLDGGVRSASVEAEQRSECALVSRVTLLDFIAEQPTFALELLGKVIARARAATVSARQMALNDCYGRLRALLESQAEPTAEGWRMIRRPATHLKLSQQIGCTRAMITRLLNDLERAGYITRSGTGLRLLGALPVRW
ncbi:Crp/Fnr family transcriptional regulator [Rubrivivax albus]|uniref:Crp/Fnr family transcriptional regulator n=1 Tax=Rubrivivax albus TaxID=2499835 RepID=A0A3S2VYI7_9BURK|nr:Crp/Fnr family transcriptional regulator [Rubrivivax albus]RVT52800.1 Crp/Fnr family transcriptional regulator [Rubrivivax albus]